MAVAVVENCVSPAVRDVRHNFEHLVVLFRLQLAGKIPFRKTEKYENGISVKSMKYAM